MYNLVRIDVNAWNSAYFGGRGWDQSPGAKHQVKYDKTYAIGQRYLKYVSHILKCSSFKPEYVGDHIYVFVSHLSEEELLLLEFAYHKKSDTFRKELLPRLDLKNKRKAKRKALNIFSRLDEEEGEDEQL